MEQFLEHPYLLVGVAVVLYFIGLSIYRLFLCPIAKFPGPKLAALTLWYEFYYDAICNGQYTFEIIKMHEKYGPIVRISPYELHIDASDPDYYEVLYSSREPRNKYVFYTGQFGTPEATFGAVDHYHHRRLRAAMNPHFSIQRIRRLEPVMHVVLEKLCARLEDWKKSGQPLQIGNAYSCLTTDIITEYMMTQSYHYLDEPDFLPQWSATIVSVAELGVYTKQFPWLLPLMKLLPPSWVAAMDPGMGQLLKFQENCLQRIKSILATKDNENEILKNKLSDQPTFFHEILRSNLPDHEKTEGRLAQEIQATVGAGTETTAHTLSIITFHLLDNPDILKTLREELDNLEPDRNTPFKLQQLEQLPYLSSIILEALRLSYGASTRLQRIAPDRSLKYHDWTIPPGTPVGMTSLLMHHNETIFPSSHHFLPSRWQNPTSRKHLEKYLVSFSKGSRQCAGMNLAKAELFLVTATLFRRFEFELVDTTREDDIDVVHDLFLPRPRDLKSKGVRVLVR